MALFDITLSYADLTVTLNKWRGREMPRSYKTFVTESIYAPSGNLIKSGTSFELPYLWSLGADLYQTDYDKIKAIWEMLDYARRNDRAAIPIDVNVTSNAFSATAHPYQNGDVVTLSTTGSLPSPLLASRDYYIVERTTNSFKLSETFGGSAIDITTTGSNSTLKTQLFVRVDDESEEIFERGKTASTKTRSEVSGTTPRELNGGVYYYAKFLADWVEPPEFGLWGISAKTGARVCPVVVVLQDTGVKI